MPVPARGDKFQRIFRRKVGTPPWAEFSATLAVGQPRYPKLGCQSDGALS